MSKYDLKSHFSGLYVITDPSLSSPATIVGDVTAALKGGTKIVQFRDKTSNFETQLTIAKVLKSLCDKYQAYLIINDNIELTKQSQAHGIHIGKNDCDLGSVRQALGSEIIIGVSCYNDLELALEMQTLGANYVAFGRFFPSLTKPDAPQAEIKTLIEAKKTLSIPIVGIGGINITNVSQLIVTGVDALAIIQGVFGQPNIEAAARQISQQFKS
ncbi:MAG: thiamine-phosphate pyrophosphorylase [Thiomicrorhabdus sp.]|nr:MAG: thiamine-phosphate pyrophosphorylase [Thiomicrorhabdus sp.]